MSEWQPIETAPKDRWILVWGPTSIVRDACWISIPCGVEGWSEGARLISIKLTHWRELPAPPSVIPGEA
jgi:hypothetical protein